MCDSFSRYVGSGWVRVEREVLIGTIGSEEGLRVKGGQLLWICIWERLGFWGVGVRVRVCLDDDLQGQEHRT